MSEQKVTDLLVRSFHPVAKDFASTYSMDHTFSSPSISIEVLKLDFG